MPASAAPKPLPTERTLADLQFRIDQLDSTDPFQREHNQAEITRLREKQDEAWWRLLDVGTTTRLRMTPTRTLRAWERTKGHCVICTERIDGTKQPWFVEHIRALELGGADDDQNLGPAHYSCKPVKDAEDHSRAAAAKRAKRAELGIRDPRRTRIPSRPRKLPKNPASAPLAKWRSPLLERQP